MKINIPRRSFIIAVLVACFAAAAQAAAPSRSAADIRVDYTVEVADTAQQLFHITTDIKNVSGPTLELSLPTWTPGWYTIENYYKNVLRFVVKDENGRRVQPIMTRKQTWRVPTAGMKSLRVEYDYRANVLALNQAKITADYAFFTGTELFLEAVGHRANPSEVKFKVPAGWRIISALKETADPAVFTAANYDNLVDCPTEMGKFDLKQFDVDGKPHYLVSTPAGSLAADKAENFTKMLAAVAKAQGAIFGGLPYEKYVYFYFFSRPESNAAGALEHSNSHVAFARIPEPNAMIGTASHEFFHLWNVKRIRPAEMWPYDYSRENETPLLWVSEGFTNYYGSKALYRASLRTEEQFIQSVQQAINGVESDDARGYIPPASASTSTWVGYDTPVAFGISYYTQGQNLGALLDLSILHDSKGKYGLDDVMRALYRDFYEKGKGFTTDDMIQIVNRLAGRDYHQFYSKYVWGVEVPPYSDVLGYAGYKVDAGTQKTAALGIGLDGTPDEIRVVNVDPNGSASKSGVKTGDVLMSIDGMDLKTHIDEAFDSLDKHIGQTVKFVVKRGGNERSLDVLVGSGEERTYKIVPVPNPTPDQLAVRQAWLKR